MATNYPTSLDNFTNPVAGDAQNSPSHSAQHADANDAIEALEAKVGIGNSPAGSATAGQVLVAGTAGSTSWTTVGASAINTTGGSAGQYLTAGTAGIAQWSDTPTSGFRNVVINGDFRIWQRGTSFSSVASATYTADRWVSNYDGTSGTYVISQQAFTVGNPITGYEPQYFLRYAVTVAGSGSTRGLDQKIEDVRTFAGQTITISFWAKADTARTLGVQVYQNFGSGGSSEVYTSGTSASLTTSWARYTTTINVPSIAGKTIGANNFIALRFLMPAATTPTIDLWGVQVEAGSSATPFEQRPIGTELALCQRYYYRLAQNTGRYGAGYAKTTTTADVIIDFPVTMRTNPSALEQSGTAGDYLIAYQNSAVVGSSVPTFTNATVKSGTVNFTVGAVLTAGNGVIAGPNGANSYLGFSAEL